MVEEKTIIILLYMILMPCVAATAQCLRPGYLLFHVPQKSNHITEVTPAMIDHVAIALSSDSVIEAVPKHGVIVTPIDSLRRQEGYYIVCKVKRAHVARSLRNARRYLGRQYDYVFLPDNDDIYCSELVQLSFVDRHECPIFVPVPMSFHDATGCITDYWRQFYAHRGLPVPEGLPGTNPAELSKRRCIKEIGRLE